MMNELTTEAVDREVLLFAVQRQMFCPISKRCLDVDSAVLIQGLREGTLVTSVVVDGSVVGSAEVEEAKAAAERHGLDIEIIDGRLL